MTHNFVVWNNIRKVQVYGEISENIIKVDNIEDHLFVLTVENNLYHGFLEKNEVYRARLVKYEGTKFVDINCHGYLYAIDVEGKLLKYTESLVLVAEISLIEKAKTCSHGHCGIKYKMKLDKLAIGSFGSLFVTDGGQLWASGNMPQIGITSEIPQRVMFFEGRFVYNIGMGNDFAVAIVSKLLRSDDTDSESEDVFLSNCPHCKFSLQQSNSQNSIACASPTDLLKHNNDNISCSSTSSIKSESNNTDSNSRKKDPSYDDTTESSSSIDKAEKNIIFRNTEAAREFLTRQISWMSSAGEEYLAECTERPTRIIKENVTSMASLVYEGVKTVGDKVVTLSRHVSGSSDTTDALQTEEIHLPRVTSKDEFMWSFSHCTSERDVTEHDIYDRCKTVIKVGSNLLNCEVWTWGNVLYGQLGIGDGIKRERPMIIAKLSNIGVQKTSVTGDHAAVLTLDGRAFIWGRNDFNQVTVDNNINQSSPRLYPVNANERVRSVACGSVYSVIYTSRDILNYIGKQDSGDSTNTINLNSDHAEDGRTNGFGVQCENNFSNMSSEIVSSSDFIVLNHRSWCKELIGYITLEQKHLEEMSCVYSYIIKPLQKKTSASSTSTVYEQLCQNYTDLLYFTAANVQSLLEYSYHQISENDIVMFKCIEENLFIYKKILNVINDVNSFNGFNYISKMIEIPQIFYKLKSNLKRETSGEEDIVRALLTEPLIHLSLYLVLVRYFLKVSKKEQRYTEYLVKWNTLSEEQKHEHANAESTKEFWLNSGKVVDQLRTPNRRLLRESHKHPIYLQNASRFSSHWFILLTDVFVHVSGSTIHTHNLATVWVEPFHDEILQNQIRLKMPEESLILYTTEAEQKAEWLQALQSAIRIVLKKPALINPPSVRSANYTFTKAGFYKDAKYKGCWTNSKMHGAGVIQWNDGKVYTGQFSNNQIHGFGRMEIPNRGIYEGQWKDNQQNGFGIFKYTNGDVYKGYFKDGLHHGHGSLKQGNFTASIASVFIGEWVLGCKNGYGVMDNIVNGEKYLGNWSDNKKHGNGLIVTSDGIYYEGVFNQDMLTGHGLMILEDGTHYEGDFKGIGHFSGKGILTLNSGHTIEGSLTGSLEDGLKISSGILNLTKILPETTIKPASFGKLCTPINQKWKALFRNCYQILGIHENNVKNASKPSTQKIWQNIAVVISNSHQIMSKRNKIENGVENTLHNLDTIPQFGRGDIDPNTFNDIKQYLMQAFESCHHPLGSLLSDIIVAYTTTYVRAHPLLLTHAVAELHSITKRLYDIVGFLFPALPSCSKEMTMYNGEESEIINYQNLLYPVVLPKVYSPLFILYTLHNKVQDFLYWKRLTEWNKQPDYTLMVFLSLDQKFLSHTTQDQPFSPVKDQTYLEAIETLQQLKTTFSPLEKLLVIRQTFEKMTQVVHTQLGQDYKWNMDDLFPVFLYVVVRARILQLGSELNFIEDFMEPTLESGELGIMFTTLKACYQQILQEKTSIS